MNTLVVGRHGRGGMKAIAICDDNGLHLERASQTLRSFARDAGMDVQIELFDDVENCVASSPRFDVVFMDIEFGKDPAGIDAAGRINEVAPDCQVVYLTNYLHYSLDVYDTDHVWYVLKDQLERRLPEIMRKIQAIDLQRHASIVVRPVGEQSFVTVPCDDICYLERSQRVTFLMMRDGSRYEVRDKISGLLEKLPESAFGRCHNSYAVNMTRLTRVGSTDLELEGGSTVPISRRYAKSFRAKYLTWIEEWTA